MGKTDTLKKVQNIITVVSNLWLATAFSYRKLVNNISALVEITIALLGLFHAVR